MTPTIRPFASLTTVALSTGGVTVSLTGRPTLSADRHPERVPAAGLEGSQRFRGRAEPRSRDLVGVNDALCQAELHAL